MKSVRIAFVLFVVIVVFAFSESLFVTKYLKEMYESVISLPSDPEIYAAEHESFAEPIHILRSRWEHGFPYLTYVSSYTALNRADEAMIALCAAFECKSYADSTVTRAQLLDALRRLLELESISISSVF